jgi:hypothetical protein
MDRVLDSENESPKIAMRLAGAGCAHITNNKGCFAYVVISSIDECRTIQQHIEG